MHPLSIEYSDVPVTKQVVVCLSYSIRLVRSFALRHGDIASNINPMLRGSGEKVRKSGLGEPNVDFGAPRALRVGKFFF